MNTVSLQALVVTVSDRCFAGSVLDESGPLAAELLGNHGVTTKSVIVVPDEADAIAAAVRGALADGADVVVLTGGTGVGPRDVTPEAVRPFIDKELPGIPEAIRAASRAAVPTTDLSRSLAGMAGRTFILAVPGSTGGVRDALAVAGPLVTHAICVARGADHSRAGA